ncbi:serine/threonine-protein kinase [Phanerochaete sordida]|uniref:Serine/threonine-protein kinase n=1 Tax=Phanerochaete sordida TaxID=48140 RepID=A0A9P3GB73_9APHY|nr:serine/threonine-protein kinase [Phanerochaete sordida]
MGFIARIKSRRQKNKCLGEVIVEVRPVNSLTVGKCGQLDDCKLGADVSAGLVLPELPCDVPEELEESIVTERPLSQPLQLETVLSECSQDAHISAEPSPLSPASCSHITDPSSSTATSSSVLSLFPPTPRHELSHFRPVRGIGKGGFGSVHLAVHTPSGKAVALKVVDKRAAKHSLLLKEQRMLCTVATGGVKGIMEFYGSFHTDTHYFLVTEYYAGGDLLQLIYRWSPMPLSLAKAYGAELLLAIKALHDIGIVHRDIKPENILLSATGHVVLADFGFARDLARDGRVVADGAERYHFLRTACGSLHYVAPEVYLEHPYAFAVDVWGFGVILFMMLVGQHPWDDTFTAEAAMVQERLLDADFDDWVEWMGHPMEKKARALLGGLLEKDPTWRLTLKEAMEYPFWGETDWDAVGQWEVPIPDVGPPPHTFDTEVQADFSAFMNSSRYAPADDPHPEFEYTSRALWPRDTEDSSLPPATQNIIALTTPYHTASSSHRDSQAAKRIPRNAHYQLRRVLDNDRRAASGTLSRTTRPTVRLKTCMETAAKGVTRICWRVLLH